MKNRTHMLVQDNDSHWFVIPREHEADWEAWLEVPEPDLRLPVDQVDYTAWHTPDFAVAVGGHPSLVTFTEDGFILD